MEEKYKNELRVIKNYLALKPNTPKYIVAAETGISLDTIIELIDQGILIEEAGELKIAKHLSIKNEERRELIDKLRRGIDFNNIGIHKINEEKKSQLLIDLENKKNEINHIRGISKDNGSTR